MQSQEFNLGGSVCRSQWVAKGPGRGGGFAGPFATIQDKPSAVQQYAAHIAPDLPTQLQVLQYGLDITGQYCQPSDLEAGAQGKPAILNV